MEGSIIKKLLKFVFDIIRRSSKDSIGGHTAHAAFFVTVSFVPFIMLLIGMVRYIPVEEGLLIDHIVSVFPGGTKNMVSAFITESYEKSGTALVSITAITTLWAASIGVYSLVKGLNRVFCTDETRNFIIVRFMSMVYTLLLMALFIVCLILFVFGDTITAWLSGFFPWIFEMALIIKAIKMIAGILVLCTGIGNLIAWVVDLVTEILNNRITVLAD